MKPKAAAEALTQFFLEQGNFMGAGSQSAGQTSAAANRSEETVAFSGLAVESVGYTVRATSPTPSQDPKTEIAEGVHIYVAKGSKRYLDALPTEFEGVACTVHNIGRLAMKAEMSSATTHRGNLYQRKGRIACGSSCAPSGIQLAGTFGAIVRKGTSGPLYALSNNHVFADCNHIPVGQPILAPSPLDSFPGGRSPGEFCRHSEMVELRSGAPALVSPCREDVAIAEITDPSGVSSWQGDDKSGYDTPVRAIAPQTGMLVKKFGRTTGLTHGIIESVQVRMSIPYESRHFRALVWFREMWSIQSLSTAPFALQGDSGSLIVTDDGSNAVGLLFGISGRGAVAFAVPMDRVVQAFGGITLIGRHGV